MSANKMPVTTIEEIVKAACETVDESTSEERIEFGKSLGGLSKEQLFDRTKKVIGDLVENVEELVELKLANSLTEIYKTHNDAYLSCGVGSWKARREAFCLTMPSILPCEQDEDFNLLVALISINQISCTYTTMQEFKDKLFDQKMTIEELHDSILGTAAEQRKSSKTSFAERYELEIIRSPTNSNSRG